MRICVEYRISELSPHSLSEPFSRCVSGYVDECEYTTRSQHPDVTVYDTYTVARQPRMGVILP